MRKCLWCYQCEVREAATGLNTPRGHSYGGTMHGSSRGRTHLQRGSVTVSGRGVLDGCCFPLFTFLCFPGFQHWACVTFIGKINLDKLKKKKRKAISMIEVCPRHSYTPPQHGEYKNRNQNRTESSTEKGSKVWWEGAPRHHSREGGRGVNCYYFSCSLFSINEHACLLWWERQNKIKYLNQMTHQVTKDLLWKRGRVPRACSWRWWGTGQRPDWWSSRACPRRSRWKKAVLRGDWFWPARVGHWWELGATTAHSSPRFMPGHWGASGVPMFSWLKALLVLFPLPGLWSIHPRAGCSDPTDLLLTRPGPRQGQSWRTQCVCGRGSGYLTTARENTGHWRQESSPRPHEGYFQFPYRLAEVSR